MLCKFKTSFLVIHIVIIGFIITGCSMTTSSLIYTQPEVKRIPPIAMSKVLSPNNKNEVVKVNVGSIDEPMTVKRLEGEKYVIVTDKRGKEIKVITSDITKIERIRRIKSSKGSHEKKESHTAESVAAAVTYAPLLPVATLWPLTRPWGLDMQHNAELRTKAQLVYHNMSMKDLRAYIGEPKEKYHCESKYGGEFIWLYEKEKVLPGGRALFISKRTGKVYHNSSDTTFFKKNVNCSIMN